MTSFSKRCLPAARAAALLVLAAAAPALYAAPPRTVAVLPLQRDASADASIVRRVEAELSKEVETALAGTGAAVVPAPAGQGCYNACAAEKARGAGATQAVLARLTRDIDTFILQLTLVDAAGARAVGSARAAGDTAAELSAALPGAVVALFGPRRAKVALAADGWPEDLPFHVAGGTVRREGGEAQMLRLIEQVTTGVEQVRGLKRKHKLQVSLLPGKAFGEALRHASHGSWTHQDLLAESARWVAFGFARSLVDPGKIIDDALDADVLGFYDPATKKLYVRTDQREAILVSTEEQLRRVLAHEIEHALQDQNFGLPDLTRERDADARLARRSLYEGDAVVTELAWEARGKGRPARLLIGTRAAALRAADTSVLLLESGYSEKAAQAPLLVREELAFPYLTGFALVSDVFRRGGFALVNRMFQHPPESTQQYLRVGSYLTGERGMKVPPPPSPAGARLITRGRLGALGTKVLLSSCLGQELAIETVGTLAGDAFSVAQNRDNTLALVWVAAFRDKKRADEFRNTLDLLGSCWSAAHFEPEEGELVVGKGLAVQQDGARVVLLRGVPPDQQQKLAHAALSFPLELPKAEPPLGEQGTLLADARSQIWDGAFSSRRLGLTAHVPPRLEPDVHDALAELIVRGPGAFGSVLFVAEAATDRSRQDLFEAVRSGLLNQMPSGRSLVEAPESKYTVLGLSADEHSWVVAGTTFSLRIATVPACGGKAYFAVVRATGDNDATATIEEWARSLKLSEGTPPACGDLD